MKLNETTEIGGMTFRLVDAEDGCLGCYFRDENECEFPIDHPETCIYEHTDGRYYPGIFEQTTDEPADPACSDEKRA